ncbi:A disintegrin and metalloproteinase with thrombospondin motifs 9-like [Haliotis rufescens]|uniref:A disintegrin and metalloproteinase with thrombospondin motifs 9-like n=1 Tax=Haliotis rufescens TaxID=6454 RepID=UPI001EAFE3EB|nr:A disintegrin and metalloproteinase with thrombospondin motifs 9-like [Haliotis rufescens]
MIMRIAIILLVKFKLLLATLCTESNFAWIYMPTHDGIINFENILLELSGVPRAECAAKCGSHPACWSFFYHEGNLSCQIHSMIFVEPTGNASDGTAYFRKPTECSVGPTVEHSVKLFDPTQEPHIAGEVVTYDCDTGRLPDTEDDVTCLISGNWTSMICKRPSTCAEVKRCESGRTDGEYWLYPPTFNGQKARIYCHGMSGNAPAEYVSLGTSNSGHYPNTKRANCGSTGTWPGKGGDTTFTKIKVNTETMEIVSDDHQFATSTNNLFPYGEAHDCYTNHGSINNCGPLGTFTIDTTGTGMRVDLQVNWVGRGWMPWAIFSRSNDGLVINLNCGGFCGRCEADRPFVLQPYPSQEPDIATATSLTCD